MILKVVFVQGIIASKESNKYEILIVILFQVVVRDKPFSGLRA